MDVTAAVQIGEYIAAGGAARHPRFGGKVRALADLVDANLGGASIPAWFALTPEAFGASVQSSGADGQVHIQMPQALKTELARAVRQLCPDSALLAVRSSAVGEDGVSHSFAGLLDSVLNVTGSEVEAAVATVWRSAFSERVLEYRRSKGMDGGDAAAAPAVLIQRMVQATVAGVAFSADPVTGESVVVIAAVPGLGESLVGGERDGDTYRVAGDTVTAVATPEGDVLTPAQARAVARQARACEAHFGRPQDTEWAFEGEALFLLQSRPITTSSAGVTPDSDPADSGESETVIWDNSNIIESYSGMTTPLTYSFAQRAYGAVYRQFCALLGVRRAKIQGHSARFDGMIGLIRGRIYYNLSNWYRLLALLPGFTLNRPLMEQMMGVNEALPPDLERDISAPGASRLQDAADLARAGVGLALSLIRLPGMQRAFYARLEGALAGGVAGKPSLAELVGEYRRLESQLLTRWDAPLVNDFFAMIFYGSLRRMGERWYPDLGDSVQNALIVGGGGMISAEPAERLHALARLARQVPGLPETLCDADLGQIEQAIDPHAELKGGAAAYLERFGDRCLDELKLESATLTDEPLLLWRSVGQLARLEAQDKPATVDTEGEKRRLEAEIRRRLSPLRRPVFTFVLGQARARVRDRENLRFERTRVFGRARRLFLEIGARLVEGGSLSNARDVFWLEVDEVLSTAAGTSTATLLRELITLRQAEFAHFATLPAPPRRFTTGGSGQTRLDVPDQASAADTTGVAADSRRGIACSPGIVRGPVRVVTDPRNANLSGPTIIVAERTDPGWILVLPLARALIVERGSLLSHSAIVSRELGIPAIVAVPGVTRWLRDGDWVELNGSTGEIRRIAADGPDGSGA